MGYSISVVFKSDEDEQEMRDFLKENEVLLKQLVKTDTRILNHSKK